MFGGWLRKKFGIFNKIQFACTTKIVFSEKLLAEQFSVAVYTVQPLAFVELTRNHLDSGELSACPARTRVLVDFWN